MRRVWVLLVMVGMIIVTGCGSSRGPIRIQQFIPIVSMPAPNQEGISYDSASHTLSGTVQVATQGQLTANTVAIGVTTGTVSTDPTPHVVSDADPAKQLPSGATALTNLAFTRLPGSTVWRWQGTVTMSPSTEYQVVLAAVEQVQEPGQPAKYMASTLNAPYQTVQFIPIVGVSGQPMSGSKLRVTIRFSADLPTGTPVEILLVRGNLSPDGHPSPGTTGPAAALPKALRITLRNPVTDPMPHTYHWDRNETVKPGDLIVAAAGCDAGTKRFVSVKSGFVK